MPLDNYSNSVLVMGATGATGLACIEALAQHHSTPQIHAFVRSPSKVDSILERKLASVQVGDARNEQDIRNALQGSRANWIIISVGTGDNLSKCDIRTANARAVVNVLHESPFRHVRTVVVSSNGAGTSKIIVGMGIGSMISFHLRHILHDHTGQEKAFSSVMNRCVVVRPTALTSNEATGKLTTFPDTKKGPSIKTDRADLAVRITEAIVNNNTCGTVSNLTGIKK